MSSRARRPQPERRPIIGCRCAAGDRRLRERLGDCARRACRAAQRQRRAGEVCRAHRLPNCRDHKGSSVVIAGDHQPPAVHAVAHAMNAALGNVGKTVVYTDPVDANPVNQTESLRDLVADMRAGKVDLLVIMGGNPVYDAPADLGFGDALEDSNIALRIHHGLYQNETAELCHWNVNEAHYLEAWSDARAYDGTVSLVQPLIAPLYAGKSAHEMLSALIGSVRRLRLRSGRAPTGRSSTPERTSRRAGASHCTMDSSRARRYAPKTVTLKLARIPAAAAHCRATQSRSQLPPRSLHLRRPIRQQRLAAGIAEADVEADLGQRRPGRPEDGEREGLKAMDVVTLELGGRKITAPVWMQAGHPDHSVTVHLGYGRTQSGPRRHGRGIRCLPAAYNDCALVRDRRQSSPRPARHYQARLHAGLPDHGYARRRRPVRSSANHARGIPQRTASSRRKTSRPKELTLYPGYDYKKSPTPGA